MRKERTVEYTLDDVKTVVEKGMWLFRISFYDKAGKRVIRRVSTGVKLENSKKRSKTHQVPDEVISLKMKLATPLVEMANHALNGGYSSSDSFFVYLDKFREDRLKNSDLSATTKKGDESRYNGIKQYQALDKPISKITTEDLEAFISKLETQYGRKGENKSRKTVQQYKLIIEGTFKFAKKKGVIDENPAEALPSYKSQPEKISSDNVIRPDKLFKFLEAIKDEYIYPCVLLSACAGLRRSEALGLRWDKILLVGLMGCENVPTTRYGYFEISQKIINIGPNENPERAEHLDGMTEAFKIQRRMKSKNSTRKVIVVEKKIKNLIIELFNKQMASRKTCADAWNKRWGGTPFTDETQKIWEDGTPDYGFVCVNDVGELITPGQVEDHWKRLKKKYPQFIGNITFHGLRHSFATYLIHNGYSLFEVSRQLGHASTQVTDSIYIHNDAGDIVRVLDSDDEN